MGGTDARQSNDCPRATRQARRKIPVDSGGRVRERGNGPRPRGQARCAVDQAGDCHRPLEGAARGRESPASSTGDSCGVEVTRVELRRNEGRPEAAVEAALDRHQARASERGTFGRIASSALEARSHCGPFPHGRATVCLGEEGRAHEGAVGPKGRGAEGCPDSRTSVLTSQNGDV